MEANPGACYESNKGSVKLKSSKDEMGEAELIPAVVVTGT
jgi:hypothetical protein